MLIVRIDYMEYEAGNFFFVSESQLHKWPEKVSYLQASCDRGEKSMEAGRISCIFEYVCWSPIKTKKLNWIELKNTATTQ